MGAVLISGFSQALRPRLLHIVPDLRMSVAGWLLSLLCISAGAVYDETHVFEPDDDTDDQRTKVQMLLQMDIRHHAGKHNQSHLASDCIKIVKETDPNLADFKCPEPSFMRYWKFLSRSTTKTVYEFMCCKAPACESYTNHYIQDDSWDGTQYKEGVNFVKCKKDQFLTQWKQVHPNSNTLRIEFTCCRPRGGLTGACGETNPKWNPPNTKLKKLMNPPFFDCAYVGKNYGLQGWYLLSEYRPWPRQKLYFRCCQHVPLFSIVHMLVRTMACKAGTC